MFICSDEKCFGCALCSAVCNTKAIDIIDDSGFYRPVIAEEKCIKCGRCVSVCPTVKIEQNMLSSIYEPDLCLAAININRKKRYNASSGGIARLLAEEHIKAGGFVVGVSFNVTNHNAEFKLFNTLDDLKNMSNSMYVQTFKKNIYDDIHNAIQQKPGLFIGVPCDIFAFKTYLKTISKDIKNETYFVDLLCRGSASPKCFRSHIDYVSKNEKVTDVSFRGGDYDCCLTLYNGSKVVYQGEQLKDPYFKYFMRHSLYQRMCFTCPFAGKSRIGDITLGDFWGLDYEVENRFGGQKSGINLMCINNAKGRNLINNIKSNIYSEERPFKEAQKGNTTLQYPTEMPKEYDSLWKVIEKDGFMHAINVIYGENYPEICNTWEEAFKARKRNIFLLKLKENHPKLYSVWSKLKKKS